MPRAPRLLALAVLAAAALAAPARGDVRQDFAAAHRAYGQGRFREALALYRAVARRSHDWQALYNAGNCHYKLGDFLQAKVHYLRARRLRPLEPAIARNIAMTDRHFLDDARLPAPGFFVRARQRLESWVSMDLLSALLLLAALALNALLFRLLSRGGGRRLYYALAFALLLFLGLGACHVARGAEASRRDVAVVAEVEAPLRSGPGEDNTVLFKVNPGLEVRIVDRAGGWVQVAASERIAGWIEWKRLILI
jgi:hypothetical protein